MDTKEKLEAIKTLSELADTLLKHGKQTHAETIAKKIITIVESLKV